MADERQNLALVNVAACFARFAGSTVPRDAFAGLGSPGDVTTARSENLHPSLSYAKLRESSPSNLGADPRFQALMAGSHTRSAFSST